MKTQLIDVTLESLSDIKKSKDYLRLGQGHLHISPALIPFYDKNDYPIQFKDFDIKNQSDRSFALRLLPLMPKDDKTRRAYIALTNPELKPLLLDKPQRKKRLTPMPSAA